MPLPDISRMLSGFDPVSKFREGREYGEQRGARQFVANNPDAPINDVIARLTGAGLSKEAALYSNRDVNNRQLAQGDRRIDVQESQFNRSFAADEAHRAASRALQREAFNLRKQGLSKAEAQQGALARYLISKGGNPEEIAQAVAAGLGEELFNASIKPQTPSSSIGKIRADLKAGLISEQDAQAAIAKATAQSGGITVSPDGTVQIGGAGAGLAKPTVNKIQDKQLNAAEMGARISDITKNFKPEFLTMGTRFGAAWNSGKAKLNPGLLTNEDRAGLSEFTTFKSGALNNINRILNELSGAAVSPQEATRLRGAMPDPGEGVFDGDDPVSFEAKLNRVAEETNKSLIRYQFYQASGGLPGSIDQIPLSDIKKVDGVWQIRTPDGVFAVRE